MQTKIYYLNFSDCVTNPHWSFPSMLLANFFLPIVSPTHSLVCTVAVWSKSRSFSEHELRGPVYISTWRLAVSVQIPLHWSRITNDDTMGQHLCMSLLCLRGAFRTLYGIPEFRRWIYSGILRRCFGLIFKKSFKKNHFFGTLSIFVKPNLYLYYYFSMYHFFMWLFYFAFSFTLFIFYNILNTSVIIIWLSFCKTSKKIISLKFIIVPFVSYIMFWISYK